MDAVAAAGDDDDDDDDDDIVSAAAVADTFWMNEGFLISIPPVNFCFVGSACFSSFLISLLWGGRDSVHR